MLKCNLTLGILAHVDAGKTTLSESILYQTGQIRKFGRVDHKDAYLDNYELERNRGITIFSKQAQFEIQDKKFTLLDTPGHVDFSAEMERTLQVLDYGILVINGTDGVQGHTRTLWKLLQRYQVPTFLFVNKMDQDTAREEVLRKELKEQLSEFCIPFKNWDTKELENYESMAMSDEEALEEFLSIDHLSEETIRRLIRERKVFPCFFGSALKQEGVETFLEGLYTYTEEKHYPEEFGARVYKVSRDSSGTRLVHLKVTGGSLKVKSLIGDEKINQIRIYSGEKYELLQEAEAGSICAVTGLTQVTTGTVLGHEKEVLTPLLEPVLSYRVILPKEVDPHTMLGHLRQLEEEDPMLHILWNSDSGEIQAQLMGEIQIEILKSLIQDRFGIEVSFDKGNVVYKETIANVVEGVGHYEPLRHYAEVLLRLEPGEPGSGMVYETACSEDLLDRNWQRLILTHLQEKEHVGVLTGSVITDMKITLIAGKAHLKHTEGGDFRQSTYRAVRQGLMQAKSVLLEPYYRFRLELPTDNLGRAMNDIQMFHGEFELPETIGEFSVLVGVAPVTYMRDYQLAVMEYTRGQGRLSCVLDGYRPCAQEEEVVEAIGYQPEADIDNPTGSIFCSHGAGYYVPWNQVKEMMHLDRQLSKNKVQDKLAVVGKASRFGKESPSSGLSGWNAAEEKELEEIFIKTYGKIEKKLPVATTIVADFNQKKEKKEKTLKEYLLVDGYNVIHAWEDLKELAKENIEAARNKLMDILCNYQGFRKCIVILVFDAYQVDGEILEIYKYHNIHVVYTKEAETADQYIEKVVHEIGRRYHVTVVTSDGVEQVITTGQGASLISAREFLEEVKIVSKEIREEWQKHKVSSKNYLFDHMEQDLADHMEQVRLGKKEL